MIKKILIIEDDINILSGLKAQFSIRGKEVLINDGSGEIKDILQQIMVNKPDYIILDVILPRLDGFELLNAIKIAQEETNIPVFIFTNLSDEDSRARCSRLGADYYFIKSEFNVEEFADKVEKIITNLEKVKLK